MKINTNEHEEKMKKAIVAFESNLSTIRAGQANPAVLNRVSFEYYGAPTPINTMADIKVTDSKTIAIMPYDASTLKAMEKAILASDIGITPTNDGKIIRLIFPQPTEERRRELSKQVDKMGEDAKVAVRNLRRDENDELKKAEKAGELTEDDLKKELENTQKTIEKAIKDIDAIIAEKEKELMEV